MSTVGSIRYRVYGMKKRREERGGKIRRERESPDACYKVGAVLILKNSL